VIDLLYRLCWAVLITALVVVGLTVVAGLAVRSQIPPPPGVSGGAR